MWISHCFDTVRCSRTPHLILTMCFCPAPCGSLSPCHTCSRRPPYLFLPLIVCICLSASVQHTTTDGRWTCSWLLTIISSSIWQSQAAHVPVELLPGLLSAERLDCWPLDKPKNTHDQAFSGSLNTFLFVFLSKQCYIFPAVLLNNVVKPPVCVFCRL